MTQLPVSRRTRLKRAPARGCHDLEAIYAILDEGLVCHIGFVHDGAPCVIPTFYARSGDLLLIHGSTANRMLRTLRDGASACVSVALVDGLVLARSAFHHSMNYRSVVIYGIAEELSDPAEKQAALRAFVDHAVPNRWGEIRPPSREETLRTMVLGLPIVEASAKLRTGGPVEEERDYQLDVWAGVVPLTLEAGKPLDDERLADGIAVPPHASTYRRGERAR